jgi:hypothetical protein
MAHVSPSPQAGASPGRVYVILAFVLGAVAVLFLPIVFGPVSIAMAAIGMSKGDPLGRWALAFAIAATIVGFALGVVVYNASS